MDPANNPIINAILKSKIDALPKINKAITGIIVEIDVITERPKSSTFALHFSLILRFFSIS